MIEDQVRYDQIQISTWLNPTFRLPTNGEFTMSVKILPNFIVEGKRDLYSIVRWREFYD